MKKLKLLAIFGVQAKSVDNFFQKKAVMAAPRRSTTAAALEAIHSIMPKTVSREALAVIDSIMVAKSRWGPLVAAGGAHYFSRGKVYTSSAKQPCRWLNSAGRPLSYRRLQQYSPAHIAAAPSRLTSSFVKQARRYQDDQKVSYMIHDSFCCGKEQPVRSSNNFSAVEAGAIQIGPAPWKPVLYKLAHHRRGKPAINKLALDTLKLKVKRPRTASCLGFRRTIFLQRWMEPRFHR